MDADFWFDPVCPWTWITARWMAEVEQVRDVQVRWHPMSLAILNAGREMPADIQEILDASWGPLRVIVAAEQEHGQEAVWPLFSGIAVRIHDGGERDLEAVVAAAVADAGLPATLAQAARSSDFDEALRASHHRGLDLVGDEVGSPIIRVPGPESAPVAFFGPVVSPAPKGEQAAVLWDGVLAVAGTPGFFELKRSRTVEPIFD